MVLKQPKPKPTALTTRSHGSPTVRPHNAVATRERAVVEALEFQQQHAKAANTKRAYASQANVYLAWAKAQGRRAFPATTEGLLVYLQSLVPQFSAGTITISTVRTRLAAIAHYQELGGYEPVTKQRVIQRQVMALARAYPKAPNAKKALTEEQLLAVSRACNDTLAGVRDRAMLLVGFMGALRRSELVSLTVERVTFTPEGMLLHLPTSKTDQTGRGASIPIAQTGTELCAVQALRVWLVRSRLTHGPLWLPVRNNGVLPGKALSTSAVAIIVKDAVERIGLDPAQYAGHTLRATFVTESLRRGNDVVNTAQHSRHKNLNVLAGYNRQATQFGDTNPTNRLGRIK
jgi:site-specific recombinase XerD